MDIDFVYGQGTTAGYGCGASLLGEMWSFGGGSAAYQSFNRQVNILYINYINW